MKNCGELTKLDVLVVKMYDIVYKATKDSSSGYLRREITLRLKLQLIFLFCKNAFLIMKGS